MLARPLGHSGFEFTVLGLGTNYVGGHNLYADVDEDEGIRLVQRAMDAGVTHLDTADAYGLGRSEELVGKAIAGRRDEVILATKGSNLFGENGSGVSNDPAYLRRALEASLRRLKVESIDLYYIHRHDGVTPVEDAFGALMDFKREGLIRAAGVSNFGVAELEAARSVGVVDAVQNCYNLLQREPETDVLPWCVEHGTAFVPWGPLAYGLLGGRYGRDFKLGDGDWRVRSGAFDDGVYERNMDIVDGLKVLAKEAGVTPVDLAIQWLAAQPGVGSIIAGAKRADQVDANVAAASVDVGADVLSRVGVLGA